jgi:signal transduction histidine kinase
MPPAAEREAKQGALLASINRHARHSADRSAVLDAIAQDVRRAFDAMRCVIYARDGMHARVLADARQSELVPHAIERVTIAESWLGDAFDGATVMCDRVDPHEPRDRTLIANGGASGLVVPLVMDGHVVHALGLQFDRDDGFERLDLVLLQSVATQIALALANAQLYELERTRLARAESLERVVRMLRDTQTLEEVLLVFAVTVAHESHLGCAVYEIERGAASRRALRGVDAVGAHLPEHADIATLIPLLEREPIICSSSLAPQLSRDLFGKTEGVIAALHIDGTLWGFAVFAAASGVHDWNDSERRLYFHMLASHLELALAGAVGFERIQHLARALSESNAFKDDLLAMLAHDFKGPLTVILGYCELLLENGCDVREEIETIYDQTKRLVHLSEDAVVLAHTQAGGFSLDRTLLDLREIVAASVKVHNRGNERIRFISPETRIPVLLDAPRFNHVLDNLLMNALKYSDDRIEVRLASAQDSATIAVSDRGIGVPAAELGSIFARFGRASNARRKGISGSGVGLYVSRKIAEAHGGSIAVQSEEGEGSTFTVTLPLAAQT